MMYQKKSNRWLMLKAVAILPVTCFAIYAFATPESKVVEKLKNHVAAIEQSIKNVETPVVEQTVEEPVAVVEQTTEPEMETIAEETPETVVAPNDSIIDIPEKNAKFEGGDEAMYRHIAETVKYPEIAKECEVQGRIRVSFVVERDGTVSDVKVASNKTSANVEVRDVEGEDPKVIVEARTQKEGDTQYLTRAEYNTAYKALEEEAKRVVLTTSGKWEPGENNGQKVRCRFQMPLVFRLN